MKALLFSAALAMSLTSASALADAAKNVQDAKAHFAQRGYDNVGINHAQQAADLYGKAAAATADKFMKAEYFAAQGEALYFVGAAISDNAQKISWHTKGINAGTSALATLGISDVTKLSDADLAKYKTSFTPAQLTVLAESIYYRGTNLGAWGQANGVVQSLSKWPDLKRSMEMIEVLGLVSMQNYGPYRVLGRGFFKIPSLMGGDMVKAEKYLSTAFSRTKVGSISKNGHNNIYYAEVLYGSNKEAQAKKILQDFIKADPNQLDAGGVIELKEAQRQASALLKSW